MLLRRRLMMAQKAERKVRTELELYTTGLVVTLGGRSFNKANEGWAVIGYCNRVNNSGVKWVSPIIVSTEPNAVTLKTSGVNLPYCVTFQYEGKTFYAGHWDYSINMGAQVFPPTRYHINNGEIFNNTGETAIIKAARALLDYYYYKT